MGLIRGDHSAITFLYYQAKHQVSTMHINILTHPKGRLTPLKYRNSNYDIKLFLFNGVTLCNNALVSGKGRVIYCIQRYMTVNSNLDGF